MAFESLARCLLIWITLLASFAAGAKLGGDIAALVPTCAQPCLESFVVANYPSTDCTQNPTLQCMCSEQSHSGYTIGEGALQCISTEEQRGICDKKDIAGSVKRDAYLMCSNVANALPNTHAVLTATIANSPTGVPASIVAPSPTQTGSTTEAASSSSGSSNSLTGGQIAGIVIGVIIAIIIIIAAIFFARRMRRRNYQGLESRTPDMTERGGVETPESGNFMSAPSRSFTDLEPPPQLPQYRTSSPLFPASPMPPRTPPRLPSPSPFLSPAPSQESFGLGISRSLSSTPASMSSQIPVNRPTSKLLPAKPTMDLTAPPRPPPPPKDLFKSDAVLSGESSARTQQTSKTSLLTNTTGVTPAYITDKFGNWVRNKKHRQSDHRQVAAVAELDTYTPMTVAPIEKKEEETETISAAVSAAYGIPNKPPSAFLSKKSSTKRHQRSSSVYSQDSLARRTRLMSYGGLGIQRGRSDTSLSDDSFTTINSYSTSSVDEDVNGLDRTHLSHPPTPRDITRTPTPELAQAKYVNVSGRLNRALLQIDPTNRASFSNSPPGQPSPTLKGDALLLKDGNSPYPKPLKPRRQDSAQMSKTSLVSETELVRPPRLDDTRPSIQSPLSRFSPRLPNDEAWFPDRLQTPPAQIPGTEASPSPFVIDRHRTPSPMSSRSGSGDQPRPHIARAVSPLSQAQTNQSNAGASSLLAKRLGNGKAVELALGPKNNKLSPPSPRGSLPATPTWQPKLTPTRHGDDLYLSVQ
ncbi:uncharacterized protein F4817DRAFT_250054 [Daldinia loculata]|uniref:uncharacterized protein n=1 Tax=Daldinia loculata TaxID=103429 RepID=UPI0020C52B15|nr:uncharacterized protein F4817DRAFT_250054 [Daldinia loculata]KAI1643558.1 hypothetical protein F4817DRAFT_250054 [Daldinia loculata]